MNSTPDMTRESILSADHETLQELVGYELGWRDFKRYEGRSGRWAKPVYTDNFTPSERHCHPPDWPRDLNRAMELADVGNPWFQSYLNDVYRHLAEQEGFEYLEDEPTAYWWMSDRCKDKPKAIVQAWLLMRLEDKT